MPDEANYANFQYSDSPELQEEFQGAEPGDELVHKIKHRVRANEDGSLTSDIIEVILPDGSQQPITKDRPENEGGTVFSIVLSKEKVRAADDVKWSAVPWRKIVPLIPCWFAAKVERVCIQRSVHQAQLRHLHSRSISRTNPRRIKRMYQEKQI